MSEEVLQVAVPAAMLLASAGLAWRLRLGITRELLWVGARAAVQLTVVGLVIAAVFDVPPLAVVFIAVMVAAAAATSARRLPHVPQAAGRAAIAIAIPALTATGLLLAVGAFAFEPRAAIPTAGILIGGAMAATSLTGRRLVEGLASERDAIEARLSLGDTIRDALGPTVRGAIQTGLVPAMDQTRNVGLVSLPGTFVGLLLGGASPAEAARLQLTVLLSVLAVQVVAAVLVSELVTRTRTAPGDRLLPPPA
ncbi:MAG: ABC transporter permease [Solirubrobacteraceae bacterium]|nr:ABC transporter permease [Solirubrobacteraceae bacterium]